jgi:glycosyltransferase involved in cell wall biosynthesis
MRVANSAPRTVLHLDSGREMRGGQWQAIRLMRGLRKRGYDNLLLAPANSPLLEHSMREGFKCDAIGIGSLLWASGLVEIVHAHDARSHTLAALWSRRPLVVSRRVAFPVNRSPLSRWKYSRPKLYAAVSETVAGELRRAGIQDKKIRVVYDGVPLLPNRWVCKGRVLLPRSHDVRKFDALALEAVALADVPFLHSSNLEADLDGAAVFVYLTYSEGLGSAALLAMSAGVPVVVSDVGGLREVVQDGETGLLVTNEVEAVAAAIRRLRESPDLALRLSTKARKMVAEKFSEDCMVAQTLAVYESVLNG